MFDKKGENKEKKPESLWERRRAKEPGSQQPGMVVKEQRSQQQQNKLQQSQQQGKVENEQKLLKRMGYEILMGLLMLLLLTGINLGMRDYSKAGQRKEAGGKNHQPCVVLDAGHGADDPGKIGCNDAKEKEINLAIVQKLKKFLEAQDVEVILTRDSDEPLYESSASNKKMSDMQARISLIEKTAPDLVVSIHQNSYHQSDVYGPQVFYYKASEKGKKAAEILQKSFDGLEEIENRRIAKANDNYYLLLHTSVPMVIAECGFLSNPQEADLLIQDTYQEKIAWVLHLGILQYLNQEDIKP